MSETEIIKSNNSELDMMTQRYNPSTLEVETGEGKFEASLDCIVRPYLKRAKKQKS
jgi:hypothetical protein